MTMVRVNVDDPIELLAVTDTRYIPGARSAPALVRPFQVHVQDPGASGFAFQIPRTTVPARSIETVTAAARASVNATVAVWPRDGANEARDHATVLIVRSIVIGRSRIVWFPARSRPQARSVYCPSGRMWPAASRPSQAHEPELAALNVHLRRPLPLLSRIRADPVIGASARIVRVVVSERPSPFGEMKDGAAWSVRAAGRRSTATKRWTWARLFDSSAVQIVIRYRPSGTTAPELALPPQVTTTSLLGRLPEFTDGPATPSIIGWMAQPNERCPVTATEIVVKSSRPSPLGETIPVVT